MKRMRPFLIAFAVLLAIPVIVQATIQQQRAQEQVTITINVTPAPLAMLPKGHGALDRTGSGIVARLSGGNMSAGQGFHAESLKFVASNTVAQNQGAVLIQAEVSPNPNATLLYPSNCGGQFPTSGVCGTVSLPGQTAGTTVVYKCVYDITVDTTQTSWTLESGLYTDWYDGASQHFAGSYVGYSGYVSPSPAPTATPFIVYSDGQAWTDFAINGGTKTYCVNLTVTIPAATAGGAYTSNAVYTLFY
jgi:hypothetical protein